MTKREAVIQHWIVPDKKSDMVRVLSAALPHSALIIDAEHAIKELMWLYRRRTAPIPNPTYIVLGDEDSYHDAVLIARQGSQVGLSLIYCGHEYRDRGYPILNLDKSANHVDSRILVERIEQERRHSE